MTTHRPDTERRVRRALEYLAEETTVRPDLAQLSAGSASLDGGRPAGWSRRTRLVAVLAATLVVSTGAMAIGSGGHLGEDSPGAVHVPVSRLAEIVRAEASEIPFAPHRSLEGAVAAWEADGSTVQNATMATDGMVDMAASAAVCSWLDQWRTAMLAGDRDAAAEAERVVEEARRWPWWSLVNQEFAFQTLGAHVTAMQRGDVNYVTYELGLNCLPAMTEAPRISPTGEWPLPDGVTVPEDFYRDE